MRILLGMSGGLDSAYAASKLIKEGHSVEGAVLVMHNYTDKNSARETARELGIKLHEIDVRKLFEEKVVSDFAKQYQRGRTPNPCVVCNREVKFKALYDFAMAEGFDGIATGHYAKIVELEGAFGKRRVISRSKDETKDQTYMLWRLPAEIIEHLHFPLESLTKKEIRELAKVEGLGAADRGESQEICFIPDGNYGEYIETNFGKSREGDFVDENGQVLGRHKGIIHYTVGQRKGLGIALGQRAFINSINPENDRIILSFSAKETNSFTVSDIVYTGMAPAKEGDEAELLVKIRYLAPPVPARVIFDGKCGARVILSAPVKSLTPGQSAVFYDGEILAFGGYID